MSAPDYVVPGNSFRVGRPTVAPSKSVQFRWYNLSVGRELSGRAENIKRSRSQAGAMTYSLFSGTGKTDYGERLNVRTMSGEKRQASSKLATRKNSVFGLTSLTIIKRFLQNLVVVPLVLWQNADTCCFFNSIVACAMFSAVLLLSSHYHYRPRRVTVGQWLPALVVSSRSLSGFLEISLQDVNISKLSMDATCSKDIQYYKCYYIYRSKSLILLFVKNYNYFMTKKYVFNFYVVK